jgi:hypothetical protein
MKTVGSSALILMAGLVLAPLAAAKLPSWDDRIDTPARFKVLTEFGNAAVLDKETGLVWERTPGDADGDGDVDETDKRFWVDAVAVCYDKTVGGRQGWRLPKVEELLSLVDPNNPTGNPDLPPGHPFAVVESSYWSITTDVRDTSKAYMVRFDVGGPDSDGKGGDVFVWCVRGGQGYEAR